MTTVTTSSPATEKSISDHGKERMVSNVLASWGGQAIRIASGFIMPRLIDRHIGQEALGAWDVSWSIIAHLALIQAGVSGSVNRYVARYRVTRDFESINRVVSSVAGVMRLMGVALLILSLACIAGIESMLGSRFAEHVTEIRWIVFLLSLSTAAQLSTGIYGGVITGFHRWDIHNLAYAITNIVMLVGGAAVLMLGGGLVGLAAVSLGSELVGRIMRWRIAHRLCPELEISRRHMRRQTAFEMVRFGGKMFLVQISQLLLNQTLNLLVALKFGPAAIALFARPSALVRHVEAVLGKYANILVPMAGAIDASGGRKAQQDLVIQSSRAGALMCTPIILFLVILGDDLIQLWMGANYVQSGLMVALAAGWFAYLAYIPLFNVLSGFNLHGKIAIANMVTAAVSITAAIVATASDRSLVIVTLAAILPVAAMNAFWLPIYSCRALGLSMGIFFRQAWLVPLACGVPFTAVLLLGKYISKSALGALLIGGGLGSVVLAFSYLKWALGPEWTQRIRTRFSRKRRASI